ncbi:MAG: hypothetical protein WCA34_11775 [Candidatus Acidiferrales bacterium]
MAIRRTSSQSRSGLFLIGSVCAAAMLSGAAFTTDHAKPKPPLENFYIVTQAIFHTDPKWVDHILEVRPEEGSVRVREIRIAPLSPACPHHVTVRAIERVIPNTTVKKVANHLDVCAFSEDDVESLIAAAKRKTGASASDDDSATQTIVAHCGTKQRVFELPDKESLRFDAITLADTHLAAFWDLAAVVEDHTFGDDFSLAKLTPEQDRDAQALGAKLVPEIKSGKYDQAFADNNCPYGECSDHSSASALQGYAGPIFSCPEK